MKKIYILTLIAGIFFTPLLQAAQLEEMKKIVLQLKKAENQGVINYVNYMVGGSLQTPYPNLNILTRYDTAAIAYFNLLDRNDFNYKDIVLLLGERTVNLSDKLLKHLQDSLGYTVIQFGNDESDDKKIEGGFEVQKNFLELHTAIKNIVARQDEFDEMFKDLSATEKMEMRQDELEKMFIDISALIEKTVFIKSLDREKIIQSLPNRELVNFINDDWLNLKSKKKILKSQADNVGLINLIEGMTEEELMESIAKLKELSLLRSIPSIRAVIEESWLEVVRFLNALGAILVGNDAADEKILRGLEELLSCKEKFIFYSQNLIYDAYKDYFVKAFINYQKKPQKNPFAKLSLPVLRTLLLNDAPDESP